MEPESREVEATGTIKLGDEVWVKPPGVRCTTQWSRGRVTGRNTSNNIVVEGVPRHILDIRPVEGGAVEGSVQPQEEDETPQRPSRERRPPQWMRDYEM